MNKQTENYISLKPIADRFREVAKSISDNELKEIIKDGLRNKVREELDCMELPLEEIVEAWFEDDDNTLWILNSLKDSIENKLYGKDRNNGW